MTEYIAAIALVLGIGAMLRGLILLIEDALKKGK